MNLQNGTILQQGKYRIEQTLGKGAFGITYLASAKYMIDGNLGKREVMAHVAIKEFFMSSHSVRSYDGKNVERTTGDVCIKCRKKFKKEAKNLSVLTHPKIVRVIDVFDENNTTYYVMEYLEGDNLDDHIKSLGKLNEREAIRIIRQIGKALDYMHSRNMVHLDVKPKNVMCRPDSSICLVDFGLSKQYDENGEPDSSTNFGFGTPGYAPLEQMGNYKLDEFPSSFDVYALGATYFKMLTGHTPPEATIVLNEGFPEQDLRYANISPHSISAIKKAMAPTKRDRYSSIKLFLNALPDEDSLKSNSPQYNTYENDPVEVELETDYHSGNNWDHNSNVQNEDPDQTLNKKETKTHYSSNSNFSYKENAKNSLRSEKKKKQNKKEELFSYFHKRNILTTVGLIGGILWFLLCLFSDFKFPMRSSSTEAFHFIPLTICLWATLRLFSNIGTGKYIPLLVTLIAAYINQVPYNNSYSIIISCFFPYVIMLGLLFIKQGNQSGFKLLRYQNTSIYKIKSIWKNRNGWVLFSIILVFLFSSLFSFAFIYELFEYGINSENIICFVGFLSMSIGLFYILLGYKIGCWIFWYGIINLFFLPAPKGDEILPVLVLLFGVLIQSLLLIRKKGKSAISVMQ